jgi:hypothetical protein
MAGASDYMVGNAPAAASYAAPLVGYRIGQALAQLPQDYDDGLERARRQAMQNAFPQGIPRKADGSPDYDRLADTAMQIGGPDFARPWLSLLQPQPGAQAGAGSAKSSDARSQANANAASVPSATGPANIGTSVIPLPRPRPPRPTASAPFAPANNTATAPQQSQSASPAQGGFDVATAQRYQRAAQHLRDRAAAAAGQQDFAQARDFENVADRHDARAQQIYAQLGQQAGPSAAQGAPAQRVSAQLGPWQAGPAQGPAPVQAAPPQKRDMPQPDAGIPGVAGGFAGARQARDGLWYMPDQSRPGRYLLILHGHG